MLHKNSPINTHPRYDNPAKGPRAVVRFFVVANVACSHCLLQNISACISPYGLAQQTQVLQEGHFTPYDHVFTLCQQMHTEPVEMLTIWLVSPRNRPRNRPRDVWFRFRFFSVSSKKPTETDRLFGEKPKNRPSHFLLSVHNPVYSTLRLIMMRIRFQASDFGLVAKINIIRAKSTQDFCAEMVLGSFVFLLV